MTKKARKSAPRPKASNRRDDAGVLWPESRRVSAKGVITIGTLSQTSSAVIYTTSTSLNQALKRLADK